MSTVAFMLKTIPAPELVAMSPIPDVIDSRLKDPEKIEARRLQFIEDRLAQAHRNPLTARPVFAAVCSESLGWMWKAGDGSVGDSKALLAVAAKWITDAYTVVTADGTDVDLMLLQRLAPMVMEDPGEPFINLARELARPRKHIDIRQAWCGRHGSVDIKFMAKAMLGVDMDPVSQDLVVAAAGSGDFEALADKAWQELKVVLKLGVRVCHLVS